MFKKSIALFLSFCVVLTAAACSKEPEESTNIPSNEFTAGNPDHETTYYSTKMITLPQHADFILSFVNETGPVFIADKSTINTEENRTYCEYTLYQCDYEGQVLSDTELQDSELYYIEDLCALDNERFVTVGKGSDFRIYSNDGSIIREGEDTGIECNRAVCKTTEGFMVWIGNKISKYDNEGKFLDSVDVELFPEGYSKIGITGIFEQRGTCYAYGEAFITENSSTAGYFRIDFDAGLLEEYVHPYEMAQGFMPDFFLWAVDYHRNTIGEANRGDIVELDLEQKKAEICADRNNMLICPPTYGNDDGQPIKVLDKSHFYRDYTYREFNLDIAEIALVVPDDSLNLADRTKITVQGAGVSTDSLIQNAAYYYNVSQNDYFITFDELTARYGFNSPESMKTTKLQLIAQYSNGNAPDIFYGDFFDYEYFGENDMVIDLKPYLGDDEMYDKMTRDDGKIYQVYAGYGLRGYFGRSDVYSGDVDISSLPDIPDGQQRFGNVFAPDLVYDMIGRDLRSIYRRGELTYENVFAAVKTAVDYGYEPDYTYENYDPTFQEDVGSGKASLNNSSISNPQSYYQMSVDFRGDPVYVGYPSIGGSIHSFMPISLVAVSSSTEHADVCCDFIRTLMTVDTQRKVCSSGYIPSNDEVLNEMIGVVKDPDHASDELMTVYRRQLIYDRTRQGEEQIIPFTSEMADNYLAMIGEADTVDIYDWGLWIIARDEVTAYYTQDKSVEDVADALYSRYLVYAQENYG